MHVLTMDNVAEFVWVESGKLDPGKLTLFGLFRDEIFFCAAFFDHYRKLGVEQFLILDDNSTDGTLEFLKRQKDCVVLKSSLTYGQPVKFQEPVSNTMVTRRAGVCFKSAIPNHFIKNAVALYLDADEFLILPPGYNSLKDVIEVLNREGDRNCAASVVEFFPENVSMLEKPLAPKSMDDLLEAYGYFDPDRVAYVGKEKGIDKLGDSKSTKLFKKYGIHTALRNNNILRKFKLLLRGEPLVSYRKTPRFKVPLTYQSDNDFLADSHRANTPPSATIMLVIAHFVFTCQFADKIKRAQQWRAHSRGADKYDNYSKLLEHLHAGDGRLTDEKSLKYTGPEQFMAAGIMVAPERNKIAG